MVIVDICDQILQDVLYFSSITDILNKNFGDKHWMSYKMPA